MTHEATSDADFRVLDQHAVSSSLSTGTAIELLGEVYQHAREGAAASSERTTLEYPGGGWLRSMTAYDEVLGYGLVKAFGRSSGTGKVRYALHLYDLAAGNLLALVDGREITDLRTGGMSGLVTRQLHGGRPVSVGIIGSGNQARAQLASIAAVARVTGVRVYSPTPANREGFAAEQSAVHDVEVVAVPSGVEAVSGADVAVIATSSKDLEPVVRSDWLEEHALVLAVGSTRPSSVEVDAETIASAEQVFVDILHAREEAGDLKTAFEGGLASPEQVWSLEDLPAPTPESWNGGRLVFKSVGNAIQDLALAAICHDVADRGGGGTAVPAFLSTRQPRGSS